MAVVAGVQVSLGLQDQAFITGLNNSANAIRNLANQVNNTAGNVNTGMAKIGTSTRAARGEMQNFAFQVQDVVVSLQMGMDPMRVFTQQAGQMAQIFGPLGATIGVALTLGGALAGSWINAASAGEKLARATDDLDGSLGKNIRTMDDAIEQFRELSAEQKEFERGALESRLQTQNAALADQSKQVAELSDGFRRFGELGKVFGGASILGEGFDVEQFSGFIKLLDQFETKQLTIGEFTTRLNDLRNEMGDAASGELNELVDNLLKLVEQMNDGSKEAEFLRKQIELLTGTALESAATTEEALRQYALLEDSWDKQAQAAKEATNEAKQAAETRAKALDDLNVEAAQLKRVGDAYKINAKAVRDAEVANAAQNKARQAGIAQGSKEYQQVLKQTDAIRTQTDANKKSEDAAKDAIREKERQAKASKDFNAGLDETLALQKLLLAGLDKESEAYRVQEALIKAKKAAGGKDPTAEEERKIKLIEQQATALDKQQEAAKEAEKIFDNMVESMQSALADTFEDIFRNGVTSFQDLADSVTDIFVRMAAELAAKKLMEAILDPAGFMASLKGLTQTAQQVAAQQAAAGGAAVIPAMAPGGQPRMGAHGMLTGGGATSVYYGAPPAGRGFMGTGVSGSGLAASGLGGAAGGFAMGSTLFPTQAGQPHTGAAVGGTFGGGIGAAAGFAATGGSPFGAAAGGIIGGVMGGFIGRQFGAGKGQDNKVFFQGSLGIGAGGTGAAAALVTGIDKSIKSLLTATEEGVTNRLLEVAAGVRAQYDKEMSANDMANLAAGRIGPAAQAIGLQPTKIAVGTPEEQIANLEAAIGIMRQIEGFRIGPVATQFRDLTDQFAELRAEADRLGISTDGLAEAQALANQELHRQVKRQEIATYVTVGAMGSLDAQLQLLNVDMQEAAATAQALGVPLGNLTQQHQRLAQALILQNRSDYFNVAEQVGVVAPLQNAYEQLNIQMQQAAARAQELGISTAGLAQQHQRLAQALFRQGQSEFFNIAERVGAISPFGNALQQLNLAMQEARAEAARLGVSTANLARTHRLLADQLWQQERQRIHGIMLAVGATSDLGAAVGNFDAQIRLAAADADRAGISLANWGRTLQLGIHQLVQEDRLRRHASLEAVGWISPLTRALYDLDAQMKLAAVEAERLGYSTARLARTHQLAASELYEQDRLRRHAIGETVGIWTPLQRALGDLDVQMRLAAIEAERLGYSTAGLAREHQRLAAAIVREHQAAIDAQALSITSPFEQMLDPLRQFATSLALGNLNPADQMKAAGAEFRRIAELARAGSTTAIQQLQGAGEAFISQMERFGASPGGAAARIEVQSVIESVMADISRAQREASAGIEDAISRAAQRQVDTLRELISETRVVAEEIKRLNR